MPPKESRGQMNWECGRTAMTPDAALRRFCSPVCCVQNKHLSICYPVACVQVEDKALIPSMFVFTFLPHCVSTVFSSCTCIPHVPVRGCDHMVRVCLCVCARVGGCRLYSQLGSVRLCLWFSHSCSDGNKGLFIVWYKGFFFSCFSPPQPHLQSLKLIMLAKKPILGQENKSSLCWTRV